LRVLANGSIYVPERYEDLTVMWEWMERQHTLALDTETTGLDIYSDGHRLRLIALATPTEAYVFPAETFWNMTPALCERLSGKRLIMHNASYDIQVLVRHEPYLSIEGLWMWTRDTKILAHQVDPRGVDEGGTGQSLENLLERYVPDCYKLKKELKAEYMRLRKAKMLPKGAGTSEGDMYRFMPIDNELFLIYAGTDAIGAARLFKILSRQVDVNSELTKNDHKVAMIATLMDAKGFLLDHEYTQNLADTLFEEEENQKDIAWDYGLENINSADRVSEALVTLGLAKHDARRGEEIGGKGTQPTLDSDGIVILGLTAKGASSVTKQEFALLPDHPLIEAIKAGRKAGKWRKTWVEKFLNEADSLGRVHPSTNTLRARTARFSITGIPAQTLPSGDPLVRSCFVADMNERIVGVDYANQELRFAAIKSPDARMIQAFRNGENLHEITARAAFPGIANVSKGTKYYDLAKMGNFAVGYGAGVSGLVRQGMPYESAVDVRSGIKSAYKGMAAFSDKLQKFAKENGYIETWTGRRLPVDEGHEYAAFNYFIQSGCRDLTAHAMIRLYDAGYVEYMRLPIHDEVLFSLPCEDEIVQDIVRIMSTRIGPLDIPAEAKIGSRSWGSLYERD
jgi:DNA polymerase-1